VQPTASPEEAVTAARAAAGKAGSLEELQAILAGFDGCGLKATAKNLCFYRGAAQARLMLIGEAPGRDEDLQGKPFVGRAGQLLDKMLAAIGLDERQVHITNIVYWRPPGNRTPTPQEAQVCRPFLERQVELVAPDLVLLVGGAAAKEVLDTADGIMRVRGKWRELTLGSRTVRALATLHPAYLLRTPSAKRLAWRDLLAVKAALAA
jgi:DNA polymerase